MEKRYFGYIRVSTAKQGEKGVSLQEQKDAIGRHAQRDSLKITQWFEERESAAKRGRPVFTQMLRMLRQNKAQGVIIHKIDRSARNLKDWSDLGELIDSGIEVHFANESLDLNTRGGRLSADIQAVVASDYIRNLREETRKGFYGRLKQGFYPLPAPLGYIDRGKAQIKDVDPVAGPLVATAFELYGTAKFSLPRLLPEMDRRGLRNKAGRCLSLTGLSTMLNNPFYTGLMRVRRTGELFPGNHQPLVSKSLFDRVQRILRGKTVNRVVRHDFTFRRLAKCGPCGRSMIGELQKTHIYYRCQRATCRGNCIREEAIEAEVTWMLSRLTFDEDEVQCIQAWVEKARLNQGASREQELEVAKLRLNGARERLGRLTDAFIDGMLEKALFENRKNSLLSEEQDIQSRIRELESGNGTALMRMERFLELIRSVPFAYQNANPDEKRDLVKELVSNLTVLAKNVSLTLKPEVDLLVNRLKLSYGAPSRCATRTLRRLLKKLLAQFTKNPPEPGRLIPDQQAAA